MKNERDTNEEEPVVVIPTIFPVMEGAEEIVQKENIAQVDMERSLSAPIEAPTEAPTEPTKTLNDVDSSKA